MFPARHLKLAGAFLALFSFSHLSAQPEAPAGSEPPDEFAKLVESISWTTSGTGEIGDRAIIEVPEGFRFTGRSGTVELLQAMGNITRDNELGYIAPDDLSWFVVFKFDDVGYVEDTEKDTLDADAILEQMREGREQANVELAERGMPTLTIEGWQIPPFYNKETNNLEWAIRLRNSEGLLVVNYRTKLLGRRGVMDAILVCDDTQLPAVVPIHQKLLSGFSYKKEESYASFIKGDKVAEYGLTGLIVGGGLLAAAKSGLLTKLWKPIAAGVVIVGAFIKKIFTGKKDQQSI